MNLKKRKQLKRWNVWVQVARTLGNSLRAFQPTIRELQQVSKEFKSTLEQEIGLDELSNPS
jgi:hypothetical protein